MVPPLFTRQNERAFRCYNGQTRRRLSRWLRAVIYFLRCGEFFTNQFALCLVTRKSPTKQVQTVLCQPDHCVFYEIGFMLPWLFPIVKPFFLFLHFWQWPKAPPRLFPCFAPAQIHKRHGSYGRRQRDWGRGGLQRKAGRHRCHHGWGR